MRYLIGVDEAGRGPLAGPVSVGAVAVLHDFDFTLVPGVRDSKKLSEKAREKVFARMQELLGSKVLRFAVSTSSATYIDTYGIVPAIKRALAEALGKLELDPSECSVLLDGSLSAPPEYKEQKTIIRGDDSEPVISMASIVAKVMRDRMMIRLAEKFPLYGFDIHKGYGTSAHRKVIKQSGLCDLHRVTFCTRLLSRPVSRLTSRIH
ncbi:MAG: ribonuclease HII [bacterium]|nr:ribonuclease HII [bacterium]